MIEALNYIGFTSPNHKEWEVFGPEVLGVQLTDPAPDGGVRMRIDDAAHRLTIHPGDADDVAYLGWGVAGPAALSEAIARLEAEGVEVHTALAELAAERGVTALAWFTDLFGFRHELTWGQVTLPSTFRPGRPVSGFLTGDQGIGHAVLVIPDLEAAEA